MNACETKTSKSYLYFNENVLKESQNPFTFEAATAAPAHRRNLKLANSAGQLGQEQAQRSLLRACKERRGSTLWVLQRSRGFTGQERGSRMGLSLIRSWWILSWVYMLCRSGKRLGRGLPPLLKTPGRTNRLILPKNTRNNYKMPLLFKPQVLFQPVAFDENTRNNHIIHLLFEAPKRTNRYKKRNDKFLYKSCHHSSLKTKPFCYRTYFPKITSTMFCVLKIEIFWRKI